MRSAHLRTVCSEEFFGAKISSRPREVTQNGRRDVRSSSLRVETPIADRFGHVDDVFVVYVLSNALFRLRVQNITRGATDLHILLDLR